MIAKRQWENIAAGKRLNIEEYDFCIYDYYLLFVILLLFRFI